MTNNPLRDGLLATSYFWNCLTALRAQKEKVEVESFLKKVEISFDQFQEIREFMSSIDFPFEIQSQGERRYLVPVRDWLSVNMDMNVVDWMAMQAHFPNFDRSQSEPYYWILRERFKKTDSLYPDLNLYAAFNEYIQKDQKMSEISSEFDHFFPQLQEAIQSGGCMEIVLKDGSEVETFAHQVVFLEGILSLIGEDCQDRCLISISLNDVEQISYSDSQYTPNFSGVEVNDFICAMRLVTGDEVRLVLKVKAERQIELNPEFHFLGNPFVTNNMEGDMIWAASVEVSNELYEWLYEIKDGVEILDPSELISGFNEYCSARMGTETSFQKKAA
ncbi:hypothetical protein HBN50_12170 [Halobacteriovorax sp. GB3]|uniref:hypothetical protein n=1 Tax=Halobacteriovorax sp. GB3 TaxID=2719615 RepID=UPI00235DEF02|nr:hypothetical protein [Halobacteriovorax sp. GB3]MDD0853858.1 hypothetical protein [Halobacteriovorax sp. GB3]